MDVDAATDVLWTLNHPGVYQLLVGERGWSPQRYEQWLIAMLDSQLIDPAAPRNRSGGRP